MKNKLICSPVNGLCNRLMSMFECSEFAKSTGRKFELKWFPEKKTNILFEDLFEYTDLVPKSDFNFNFENFRKSDCELQLSYANDTLYVQRTAERRVNLIRQPFGRGAGDWKNLVVASGGGMPIELSKEETTKRKQHFYSSLVVKKDILSNINELWNKYYQKNILGVQIRAQDKINGYHKIPRNKYEKIIKNICESSLNYIIPMANNYDHVYLASDEMIIYDFLSEKIENLIHQPRTSARRSTKEGMIESLIDWYLLGECNDILLSPGSTFGREACFRNGANGIRMKGIYK